MTTLGLQRTLSTGQPLRLSRRSARPVRAAATLPPEPYSGTGIIIAMLILLVLGILLVGALAYIAFLPHPTV